MNRLSRRLNAGMTAAQLAITLLVASAAIYEPTAFSIGCALFAAAVLAGVVTLWWWDERAINSNG